MIISARHLTRSNTWELRGQSVYGCTDKFLTKIKPATLKNASNRYKIELSLGSMKQPDAILKFHTSNYSGVTYHSNKGDEVFICRQYMRKYFPNGEYPQRVKVKFVR